MSGGKMPKNLGGYHLEKERGGFFKRLIFVIIVALILLYLFKRQWFDVIVDYIIGLFRR